MDDLAPIGRSLLVVGLVLAGIGLLLMTGTGLPLGRLPGDIRFQRDGVTVFIPLGTMLVVSVVLSLLLWVFGRGQ
ncbi:MAG: DUF2905 domain-containing protein [Chloroflexi bacterium]|jgi:hypothetical protein|nr:MAG: DUF2905 domain-containing protein [Chloroflexota bacterium]